MNKMTYEDLRSSRKDLIIYDYLRGSWAYGLQKPDGTSDRDSAQVFLEPKEWLLGLGLDFKEQLADERGDNVAYSLKKFMTMLLSSNPTVLESLFIPDRCIYYEHPLMTEIKRHREKFLTKDCFKPFLGYAKSQILKCRSLHKMCFQEDIARKTPLDFCYTTFRQGSTKVENWLDYRGMKQKYVGLVNVPNMANTLNAFYDWGTFFKDENISGDDLIDAHKNFRNIKTTDIITQLKAVEDEEAKASLLEKLHKVQLSNMAVFIIDHYGLSSLEELLWWHHMRYPIGYKGIVGDDGMSCELRLSSVAKGELPIFTMTYNKDAYQSHCKDYKNMQEWKKNRNPERYKENKVHTYDHKNVSHAIRLLHMGIEIAKGEGFNVDRTNIDRDFIMNIRLGNMPYEEVIEYVQSKNDEMKEVMEKSTLPEHIDVDFVNGLLLDIRKAQFGKN